MAEPCWVFRGTFEFSLSSFSGAIVITVSMTPFFLRPAALVGSSVRCRDYCVRSLLLLLLLHASPVDATGGYCTDSEDRENSGVFLLMLIVIVVSAMEEIRFASLR
ncbi:PREDICTED: uncharacterized protein LOC109155295 [Ipomoea nil]|uniref:uncharacterized protein LOC109155295 n=1 Tax=Ipomoea nil TaxID=35883 RepID=UPI000901E9C0|nr:PREDICTED: uncharacterized protein LOC109155295 [Ipomoea nil]